MALSLPQQIRELLAEKKNILIAFRKDAGNDTIAAALALLIFLERQGKQVDVVAEGFVLPKSLGFLKRSEAIRSAFSHLQRFILTVDVKDTGVEELSYDVRDQKLRIFITPKQGFLSRDHVRTAQTDFKYQLIFTLDTPDLESLGTLYDNNTDLFYKVPIVNLTHDPASERFGQINVTDLTVPSTAEILLPLMHEISERDIDNAVATALLTSMIAATRSFKSDNVKPHTLATASSLMTLGADREEIVRHLYRTRSIATLKLWGYALTHMQTDRETGLVWSTITRDDFVRAGAEEQDLRDIVGELISTAPEAKVVLLLHEHRDANGSGTIHGILHAAKGSNARTLAEAYGAMGHAAQASFTILDKSLSEAEAEVTTSLKKILKAQ